MRAGVRRYILLSVPLFFFSLFFFYPLITAAIPGLNGEALSQIIGDRYYRRIISFTVIQAVASTLLTLLLGLPGAYIISHYKFRGKGLVRAITTIPFIMPSLMVAAGFIILFGSSGFFASFLSAITGRQVDPGILYSWKAIILAHAFYNFPIIMRMVGSSWEKMDADLVDAARTLGADRWQTFRRVVLPYLYPSIAAASLLTFTFCFMSFAVVLILGGVRYTTIEVSIYTLSNVMFRPGMASAMAIVQISVSLIFLYLYLKFAGRERGHGRPGALKTLGLRDFISAEGVGIALYSVIILLLVLGPMIAVVWQSLTSRAGSFTLGFYSDIFSARASSVIGISPLQTLVNSLYFAALAVLFSLILSLLLSYAIYGGKGKNKSWLDPIFMLPMGVSAVTLGFGMIRAFISPPIQIYGSWWAIVIAHTVIAFPFVFRSVSGAVQSIDKSFTDAARTLGASRLQSFLMVELPQITPGIVVGATFGFAISIGEFGATLMLYRPQYSTIPIAIYRFLAARNFGAATAMAVILMLIAGISFLMIERFSEQKVFQ